MLRSFPGNASACDVVRLTAAAFCVGATIVGSTANASITQSRQTAFTYNANGLLETETVEPYDSAVSQTKTYVYDVYGNKTSVTLSGGDFTSRSTSTYFDQRGQFPLSASNALGHTESWVHEDGFGNPVSQTGPNGISSSFEYDAFGRPTKETAPDGTYVSYEYDYCDGTNNGQADCPDAAAYVVIVRSHSQNGSLIGPISKSFNDRLGREVATETQGFDGSPIRVSTEFDPNGRPLRESKPYFLSDGPLHWTVYEYDVLSRTTRVNLPDGSDATTTYNGLVSIQTNDLGQTTKTVKNARGEVISITVNENFSGTQGNVTTSYTYDAFGNLTSTTDESGNVSVTEYDKIGRKTDTYDPDMGHWSYQYNALGELISQTDAKGQTTTLTYDLLGRTLTRTDSDGQASWTYDVGTKAIGKLTSTSTSDHTQSFVYDTLGRPIRVETTHDTTTETIIANYDYAGRLGEIKYPSGLEVEYGYNAQGYHSTLTDIEREETLWQANTLDAELRILSETAGNGVTTSRTYNTARGVVSTIEAGVGASVAEFYYHFDAIGNLTSRGDLIEGVQEEFQYDAMNRVTAYGFFGYMSQAKTVAYDKLGNITSKSDVGAYTYAGAGNTRPHAVLSTSGVLNESYAYDANGNMTSGAGRTISWTVRNKVSQILDGAATIDFRYDASNARASMQTVYSDGRVGNETFYYNGFGVLAEKIVSDNNDVEWKDYIVAGEKKIAVTTSDTEYTTGSGTETHWFVTDHLGSVAVITDEQGGVVERLSYDAWGKRRYPDGSDDNLGVLTSAITTRGFTGHEMIDATDLVNMNGRIYDPSLGRFLSADPFIQDRFVAQSLNRYSYVWNNPLSYTDPSGHFVQFILPVFEAIKTAGFVASILSGPVGFIVTAALGAGAESSLALFLAQAAGQAAQTLADGGGISDIVKGFALSAIQAGSIHGIGEAFGEIGSLANEVGRAAAHGLVGGAFAEATGGDFAAGFLASGLASAAGSYALSKGGEWEKYGELISAAAGGAGAALGGGKFLNGAQTGAAVWLYNHAATNPMSSASSSDYALPSDKEMRDRAGRKILDLSRRDGDREYSTATYEIYDESTGRAQAKYIASAVRGKRDRVFGSTRIRGLKKGQGVRVIEWLHTEPRVMKEGGFPQGRDTDAAWGESGKMWAVGSKNGVICQITTAGYRNCYKL